MSKIIVASFKDQAKAIEALHQLSLLESFGHITVYEEEYLLKINFINND